MHFRIRRKVVQLVRTSYDGASKKPKAAVVGRLSLERPEVDEPLKALLTADERKEVQAWIDGQYRTTQLREELAGLTLADTVALATRWYARSTSSPAAEAAAAALVPQLQELRKTLRSAGLLD